MGFLKKASCVLLACVFCAAPVRAETAYTATELTLPKAFITSDSLNVQMSVHGERLDLFTNANAKSNLVNLGHYRSTDGGKTWKQENIDWLTDAMAKMCQFGGDDAPWLAADAAGAVYALFNADGSVDLPTGGYNYYKGKLVRYRDGVMTELFTFDDPDVVSYHVLGDTLGSGAELVLCALAQGENVNKMTGKKTRDSFIIYDFASGRIKTKTPVAGGVDSTFTRMYAGGKAVMNSGGGTAAVDVSTGRVLGNIPELKNTEDRSFGGGYGGADGSFYGLTKDGLFRLKPGAAAWEQIADSSACKLGTAGSNSTECRGIAADGNGNIYILLKHLDEAEQRTELKAQTLTLYTTQS